MPFRDFSLLDVDWKHHIAGTNRSGRLVKHTDDTFMVQVLRQLTRKDALIVFVFNREGCMNEVVIDGYFGHSNHKAVEYKISADRRKRNSKTSTLGMRRADFRLLGELVTKVHFRRCLGPP